MDETPDVLVIGAGLAGLAAARDLARDGLSVHVLDKSRTVSGRAATRWLEVGGKTLRIDHGAQYFTVKGDSMRMLLPELMERGVVAQWTQGFPLLNERGIKNRSSGHPRYSCPEGMSALGKAFHQGISAGDKPLSLELKAGVTGIQRSQSNGEWLALLEDGGVRRGKNLLVNVPAPQALRMGGETLQPAVRMALNGVRYEPCWAAALVLDSLPYLDWVGLEINHPVLNWAALDHTKRPVQDPPVLVLHASTQWSREHLELSNEEALAQMVQAAKELLGNWVGQYRIGFAHRWRYALASQTHPWPFLSQDNLVFCGDWCLEPAKSLAGRSGRIEGAIESGWAAAEHLIHHCLAATS